MLKPTFELGQREPGRDVSHLRSYPGILWRCRNAESQDSFMGFVLAASSVRCLERPANPTATVLDNVGRQVRAAILGAAIRPLLRVWEPSVGQVSLPLRRKHKELSEAFGNKRSNFQSCQENSEPPMDKVMTARKRTLKPAQNQFLQDLIRGADPRLTASPSQLGIFAKLRKNCVQKKLDQMENRFHLVLSKHYISHQDSSASPFRRCGS